MNIPVIDGHWIDIGSILSGFLYIAYKQHHIKSKPKNKQYRLISKSTSVDFGNGIALFPLVILMFSAISSDILKSIAESSAITLAVAGFYGVLAILEDS